MERDGKEGWGRNLAIGLLAMVLALPVLGKETVTLQSADGKTIEAVLLEKGKDAVKVEVGRKIYKLPYAKLAPTSVALVKKANVPVMCDFELKVDLKKRGDKVTRNRQVSKRVGDRTVRETEVDSYRYDEVDGSVFVENRDVADPSPTAKVEVAVLCRGEKGHVVINRESFPLKALDPLTEKKFEVKNAKSWHSQRGQSFSKGGIKHEGRYSGYVVAVVAEGRIVALKANPTSYERDLPAVRKMLGLKPVPKSR